MKHIFTITLLFTIFLIPQLYGQQWVKVEAGTEFSLGLKSDGTIWAWGFNGNGQLGGGSQTEALPIQVGTDSNWKDISVGALNSFAIKENGTLWAWGFNYYGQLGLGTTSQSVPQPELVGLDTNWAKIEAGVIHTLALKTDSTLWSFGGNAGGALGHSQGEDVYEPTLLDSQKYIDLAAGGYHSLAIRKDQTLWGWGDNGGAQVSGQIEDLIVWTPTLLDSSTNWMNVEGGFQFSAAQKTDSTLYTWGFNGNNQLGHSIDILSVATPTLVDSTKNWRMISAGSSFMHAILEDGSLWAWGFNGLGQLGVGNTGQRPTPVQVGTDTNWHYISDANGFNVNQNVFGLHSLGLKGDATSICVSGANYQSQLGTGGTDNRTSFDCTVADISTFLVPTPAFTAQVDIYPNPVQEYLHVRLENAQTDWVFELYDAQSRLQFSQKVKGHQDCVTNIQSLPAGMYWGIIKLEGRVVASEKVIVAR